ncbi:glycosyltransferase family 4 protein [Brachybacterium paraconglomeratum]|uniref:glycosyltransferase family 4 protein n=1 Tax=Brachybacterium paraconglomeratum TaxID=173362 RepID=UPI003FD4AB7F
MTRSPLAVARARLASFPPVHRWPSLGVQTALRRAPLSAAPVRALADGIGRTPGAAGALASFSVVHHDLAAGRVDLEAVQRSVTRLLGQADRALAAGRAAEAGRLFDLALQLSYHPSVHFTHHLSPLAADPEGFLAPYTASRTARLMITEPDAAHPTATPTATDRPRRVLVLAHDSWTFVDRVREDLTAHADVEFRTLAVGSLPAADRPSHRLIVPMRLALAAEGRLAPVPEQLAPELEWADVVMVEWGTYPLAWFSLLDTERFGIEVVARLHRFEAYTPYPMLTRFSRLSAIALVSEAVRELVARQAPRLAQAGRVEIVRNVHSYEGFVPEKDELSPFTLVQIGWTPPVKDVLFSLEVLRRLRQHDRRYRLLLVGAPLPERGAPHEQEWFDQVRAALDANPEGVEILGYRDDVPRLLAGAGFLLSSSLHEGTHESVAEAAMAGCVPVVRDWPEAVPFGGAAVIYPEDWVVADVASAVDRVLAHLAPEQLELDGAAARAWVQGHRAPEDVRAEYIDLLGLRPRS